MSWPLETRFFVPIALVAAVALGAFPHAIPQSIQLAVLALGVVVLGLPHGALDPAIADRAGLVRSKASLWAFNTIYTAVVLAVIGLWWLAPVFSLALFLVVSAWHFAGDWRDTLPWWAQGIGGAGLLLMPITFHTETVSIIFVVLSGPGGSTLAKTLSQLGWVVPLAMLSVAGFAVVKRQWASAMEFAALVLIGILAPPLVFFIIYFCSLHSPRHLREHFQQVDSSGHRRLWRMLVVYTLATLLLIIPMLWLWSSVSVNESIVRLVFVGLAAVTVPHMMLMVYAESKTSTTQC